MKNVVGRRVDIEGFNKRFGVNYLVLGEIRKPQRDVVLGQHFLISYADGSPGSRKHNQTKKSIVIEKVVNAGFKLLLQLVLSV